MRGSTLSAPHALNRFLLIVLALLIIAAGGAGIAAALGAFGSSVEHHTLYDNPAGRYVGDNGRWIWPVAAAVLVIIALFALRWLLTQISIERAGSMTLQTPSKAGSTTLRAAALTDAVTDEIETYRGVTSARAHLLGDPGDLRLAVTVTTADRVPFGPLRERIETTALADARKALGDPTFPIVLVFDTTTKPPS